MDFGVTLSHLCPCSSAYLFAPPRQNLDTSGKDCTKSRGVNQKGPRRVTGLLRNFQTEI